MDTVQRLSRMSLFDAMAEEELSRWAQKFKRERHLRGEVVIRQNDPPTAFYIVDQGELRACARATDGDLLRAYFYPGDYFGETGLLIDAPRNATVDVLTDAELLVLDGFDFDQLVEEYPEIRDRLYTVGQQRELAGRMRFSWLGPGEVTVFFSTKHWVALVRALPLPFLMGVLGLIVAFFYSQAALAAFSASILMIISGTLLALAVLLLGYRFLDWRNDDYIVTNVRAVHVERVLLLREDRDEAPIERVQDVQVRKKGILSHWLDFGDVIIQTAAATEKIVFTAVPSPEYVRDAIYAPTHYVREQEKAQVRESIRQELGQRLNIAVIDMEDQAEPEAGDDWDTSFDEGDQEATEPALGRLDWLRWGWQWFCDQFTFETWIISDDGETITWRRNGWLLLKVSLSPVFSGLVVIVLFLWTVSQGVGLPLVPLGLLFLFFIVFGWWFYFYWDWQNDIYQISGNRLIDLKKRPLFLEEMRRETTLDRVENVGLSIPGPIAKLLNYGTVIIETAGETGAFEFENVHNPRGVQAEIFNRREEFSRKRQEAQMIKRHSEMAEWFEIYEELKQERETTEMD